MSPFLFGFQPSIEESPFDEIQDAYRKVGENTGNLAFCYAITRAIGRSMPSTLWHASPDYVKTLGDIGVLTLANQLGPHVNLGYLVESFNKLDVSLVGIGLGAQASAGQEMIDVPQGTLDWVRAMQERSPSSYPNIGVRGDFSLKVLDRYGLADKAITIGCPTLFINPDKNLGKTISDKFSSGVKRIAVAAGHQRWSHLAKLEASLVALSQGGGGAYICQSPIEMVQLGRGEVMRMSADALEACRKYAAPSMSGEEFIDWSRRYALSFFSASAWMEYLRRFDFVVGTRIHGVMLALQVGIPALCFAHDSRTIELCETMLVPYVKAQNYASGVSRDQLISLFDFDFDSFDKNRAARARVFVEFLSRNNLPVSKYLIELAS